MSIVGPSGAGQSTLLHLLGALDSPDSGSIRFAGQDIAALDDNRQSEFRRHWVGFGFQFFNLLPTLSACENVAVPKLLDGVSLSKGQARGAGDARLGRTRRRAEHGPSEMSGGQMQRVALARALVMDPPLVLADEPPGNLDSASGAAVLELLGEIARTDGAQRLVVMVTHNLDAARGTDRIITPRDGRIDADEQLT